MSAFNDWGYRFKPYQGFLKNLSEINKVLSKKKQKFFSVSLITHKMQY